LAKVLRRKIPNWLWLLLFTSAGLAVMAYLSFNKPLPEYLVASSNLRPGQAIERASTSKIALDLGDLASLYLESSRASSGLEVTDFVGAGELIPLTKTRNVQVSLQTVIRLTPSIAVPSATTPGSWVAIWRVVENDDHFESQQLIGRAKVLEVLAPEGLFADQVAQVELMVDKEMAALIIETISAEFDIYLLPTT
jgi:hypothetical protein